LIASTRLKQHQNLKYDSDVVWITNDRKLKSITKIKSVVKQKRLFSNCAAWGLMQPDELKTGIYVLAIFSDERNARRILQSMVEILCS